MSSRRFATFYVHVAALALSFGLILSCAKEEQKAALTEKEDNIVTTSVEALDNISFEDIDSIYSTDDFGAGLPPETIADEETSTLVEEDADIDGALEDISELNSGEGEFAPPQAQRSVTEGVIRRLNPIKRNVRKDILRLIEAPIVTTRHFLRHRKECVTITGDDPLTCPGPRFFGDWVMGSCTLTLDFGDGCDVSANVDGKDITITFTGILTSTISSDAENQGSMSTIAVDFKGTSGDKYIILNGTVSSDVSITRDETTGEISIEVTLKTSNLKAEDSAGDIGTADGTRKLTIIPSKFFKAESSGTLTYTKKGEDTITFQISITKQIKKDDNTIEIIHDETINRDGSVSTRSLTLTVNLTPEQGQFTINGTIEISNPKGTFQITLNDVIVDKACDKEPVGGSLTVRRDGKELTITFDSECNCMAKVQIEDKEVEVDICKRRSS